MGSMFSDDQDALAQRVLVEQRGNLDLGDSGTSPPAAPAGTAGTRAAREAALSASNAFRAAWNTSRCSRNSSGSRSRSMVRPGPVRGAAERGRDVGADGHRGRIEFSGPTLFQSTVSCGRTTASTRSTLGQRISKALRVEQRLDLRAGLRRWRRLATLAGLQRDGQRHTETFTYSGRNSPSLVQFVGHAPQPAADHLLAQQLAGEGAQAHDVGDVLRVPAFGQHGHRNHVLQVLAGLAALADGVHHLAQQFFLLQPGQPLLRGPGMSAASTMPCSRGS